METHVCSALKLNIKLKSKNYYSIVRSIAKVYIVFTKRSWVNVSISRIQVSNKEPIIF